MNEIDLDFVKSHYMNASEDEPKKDLQRMPNSEKFSQLSLKKWWSKDVDVGDVEIIQVVDFVYMEYVVVVKDFIYVERTSNWKLHLHCVSKMLNLFAATGHSNYAQCARFYLQEMKEFLNTHLWLYDTYMQSLLM